MIQQDSIQVIVADTAKAFSKALPAKQHFVVKADTASIVDSIQALVEPQAAPSFEIPYLFLQKPDSSLLDISKIIESFKPVTKIVSGFEGIAHPMLPQTATWVFGILIALFLLLIISLPRYSTFIFSDLKLYFQNSDRTSLYRKTTLSDFNAQIILIIFSIAVFSLFAYLYVFNPTSDFYLEEYGVILGITAIFFVVKYLLILIVGSVFVHPNQLKIARFSYFNIVCLLGVFLYPFLVMRVYSPANLHFVIGIISIVLCISAYVLIIVKFAQLFLHKLVASFYILLYLCTLEILPLFILYKVYQILV